MGVRAAALAGDSVDSFDMLRAEIVENFADDAYALIFSTPGLIKR